MAQESLGNGHNDFFRFYRVVRQLNSRVDQSIDLISSTAYSPIFICQLDRGIALILERPIVKDRSLFLLDFVTI